MDMSCYCRVSISNNGDLLKQSMWLSPLWMSHSVFCEQTELLLQQYELMSKLHEDNAVWRGENILDLNCRWCLGGRRPVNHLRQFTCVQRVLELITWQRDLKFKMPLSHLAAKVTASCDCNQHRINSNYCMQELPQHQFGRSRKTMSSKQVKQPGNRRWVGGWENQHKGN